MNLITLEIFHQKNRVNINRLLLNRDPKNYRNKNSLALNAKQAKICAEHERNCLKYLSIVLCVKKEGQTKSCIGLQNIVTIYTFITDSMSDCSIPFQISRCAFISLSGDNSAPLERCIRRSCLVFSQVINIKKRSFSDKRKTFLYVYETAPTNEPFSC